MAAISSSSMIRPLLRLRAIPPCLPHRYTRSASKSARTRTVQPAKNLSPSPKPKTSISPPPPPGQSTTIKSSMPAPDSRTAAFLKDLGPELARKQWYAQRLYRSGRTMIYRPPSHAGIYAASWIFGGTALCTATFLAYGNLWAWSSDPGLPWFVPVAHRCGIVVFSGMGWLALMRSLRFVRSIDLVSVDGLVKMAIQVRRPLPFLPPRQYLLAPYELKLDQQFVQPLEYPEWIQDEDNTPGSTTPRPTGIIARIGRTISQGLFYPFAATRRLLTMEGFMSIHFEGARGKMKLDTQGFFSNAGKDLAEMGVVV